MSEMVKYYPQIKAAFKHMVPIAVAFNITQPYVETNVTYPSFDHYTAGDINQTTSASPSSTSGGGSGSSASGSRSSNTAKPSGAASFRSEASPLLGLLGAGLWYLAQF